MCFLGGAGFAVDCINCTLHRCTILHPVHLIFTLLQPMPLVGSSLGFRICRSPRYSAICTVTCGPSICTIAGDQPDSKLFVLPLTITGIESIFPPLLSGVILSRLGGPTRCRCDCQLSTPDGHLHALLVVISLAAVPYTRSLLSHHGGYLFTSSLLQQIGRSVSDSVGCSLHWLPLCLFACL